MADLSRWPEADALLDEALELQGPARTSWLAGVARRDAALAQALAAVLREDEPDEFLEPGGALRSPVASDLAAAQESDDVPRLPPGTRFGPYRVVELLGRGGMGEVHRARDVRLERDVALKVLPARWAADAGRRARFDREARVLASLRHTAIAAIYHVEEHAGIVALVLEVVEGQTLAERLEQGPLDWRAAVSLARQLVEALDAAHQRGIVHRDLKPANVKLPPEGGVKVLDFGLARAFSSDDDSSASGLTTLDGQAGQVLGTAAYMSPEQAMGKRVDARTDVWAFGCVLFEMLAGQRAFGGTSIRDVLTHVVERDPDFDQLPPRTPEPLRRLLRRCLQKDPRKRLGYIGDALLDFDEAVSGGTAAPEVVSPRRGARLSPFAAAVVGAAVAGATVAAAAGSAWWVSRPAAAPPRTLRLALPLVDGERFFSAYVSTVLALSPDGSTAVYRAQRGGVMQLYVRGLDAVEAIPLPGTANATGPFFSPDRRWLAFDRDGVLMKVSFVGGPAVRICDAPGGMTGAWADDDVIYFSAGVGRVIQRVPASGGTPVPLTTVRTDEGEISHATPAVVPGHRMLLFTIFRVDGPRVAKLDLTTGEITPLIEGKQPYYLPSGHLVFARGGALWVAPFDVRRGAVTGAEVPAVTSVLDTGGVNGGAQFALSPTGALLYAPVQRVVSARDLLWYDRSGVETALPLEPRGISRLALAPDGTRVAMSVGTGLEHDIWIYDLRRDTLTRVTSHPEVDTAPVWSPDGRTIAFRSDREGGGLFLQQVDPPDEPRRLTRPNGPMHTPYDFTHDGRAVLFTEFRSYPDQDIGMVDIASGEVTWLLTDPVAQMAPHVSPDGRWLAYAANDSGRFEVYVRPFPDVHAARWQVSSGGGQSPRWSPNGRELWFDDGKAINVVDVTMEGGTLSLARPRPIFSPTSMYRDRLGPTFDIAPDGKRMITTSIDRLPPTGPSPLMILENWLPRGGPSRAR
jgi:eukaryotic-like serine/threonine-protein kinase